jgi:hypothetical protein
MAVDVVVGDHDRPSMRDVTAYARSGQRHGWYENIKSVKWESPSPLVLGSRSSPSSMACPPCTHRRTSTARSSGRSSRRSNGSCAHTSPTRPSNRWPLERRRSQPRGRDAVRAGSRGRQYDPPLLRRSSDPRVDRQPHRGRVGRGCASAPPAARDAARRGTARARPARRSRRRRHPASRRAAHAELAICPDFRVGDEVVRTVSMVARFDTARELTLDELQIELTYPRDAAAERFFRDRAAG